VGEGEKKKELEVKGGIKQKFGKFTFFKPKKSQFNYMKF
jgi:hypothetical protein